MTLSPIFAGSITGSAVSQLRVLWSSAWPPELSRKISRYSKWRLVPAIYLKLFAGKWLIEI
jgi:hypothetical protein